MSCEELLLSSIPSVSSSVDFSHPSKLLGLLKPKLISGNVFQSEIQDDRLKGLYGNRYLFYWPDWTYSMHEYPFNNTGSGEPLV